MASPTRAKRQIHPANSSNQRGMSHGERAAGRLFESGLPELVTTAGARRSASQRTSSSVGRSPGVGSGNLVVRANTVKRVGQRAENDGDRQPNDDELGDQQVQPGLLFVHIEGRSSIGYVIGQEVDVVH